jgi:hypothetical protein
VDGLPVGTRDVGKVKDVNGAIAAMTDAAKLMLSVDRSARLFVPAASVYDIS